MRSFILPLVAIAVSAWSPFASSATTLTLYESKGYIGKFFPTDEAAADNWFSRSKDILGNNRCRRYYYGTPPIPGVTPGTGGHRDAIIQDGAWTSCTAPWNVETGAFSIAEARECSTPFSDDRCDLEPHPATAEDIGGSSCGRGQTGNPIEAATGNKLQIEQDFSVPGSPWLSLVRRYNSNPNTIDGAFGRRTAHSLEYRLGSNDAGEFELYRPDGATRVFTSTLQAKPGVTGYLAKREEAGVVVGWAYDDDIGQVESYDLDGRIQRIDFIQGGHVLFGYTGANTHANTITDHFGRTLSLTLNAEGLIQKVTLPSGAEYTYSYLSQGRLSTVTKPGGRIRTYKWDEPTLDKAQLDIGQLTGIVDEANIRFASYGYNARRFAISTVHGTSAGKTSVDYAEDGTPTVTLPMGAKVTHQRGVFNGRTLSTGTTTSLCSGTSCNQTTTSGYDANGNLSSYIDEVGTKFCRSYDLARNLMLKEVTGLAATADCNMALASPPAGAWLTTTQWHAELRKPVVVASPNKRTMYAYDAAYRLTSVTTVSTTDQTGALGVSAPTVGASRTTSFAYNNFGQIVSEDGPRTDINDVTTFAYDASGNFTTMTNPLGHVTAYSAYDADGRVGRIQYPDGTESSFSYDNRGLLLTSTTAGLTTTFEYDNRGLLVKESQPAGKILTYEYDTAQRLVGIKDQRGAATRFAYNSGNGVTESKTLSAVGGLVRVTNQTFDWLNRPLVTTGAQEIGRPSGLMLRP